MPGIAAAPIPTDDMFVTESGDEHGKRNGQGATFGEWRLVQVGRLGTTGDLAAAAKADPKFPRRGSPVDVCKRLNEMQTDGDLRGIVDDAVSDWMSN